MKERPILFSSEMVRAILAGKKSMTRRVLKPQPSHVWGFGNDGSAHVRYPGGSQPDPWIKLGYAVGDRLWVRETWCRKWDHEQDGFAYTADDNLDPSCCYYRADGDEPEPVDGDGFRRYRKNGEQASPWVTSIFMPRWACRLELVVTAVRVERLQDISEDDARAEGVKTWWTGRQILREGRICNAEFKAWDADGVDLRDCVPSVPFRESFRELWDSLNAKRGYSWESNPFVVVVSFERSPAGGEGEA